MNKCERAVPIASHGSVTLIRSSFAKVACLPKGRKLQTQGEAVSNASMCFIVITEQRADDHMIKLPVLPKYGESLASEIYCKSQEQFHFHAISLVKSSFIKFA